MSRFLVVYSYLAVGNVRERDQMEVGASCACEAEKYVQLYVKDMNVISVNEVKEEGK
jgi:uncharacterized protein YxeA